MLLHAVYIDSPIGWIEIKGNELGVFSVLFLENVPKKNVAVHPLLKNAVAQLKEYFAGKRTFFDVKINPEGSDFQKNVWQQLIEIPFGKTRSYLDIAIALGDKNATRAIGNANGKNPISIIVPCHRVIGTNGKLTGYAGGLWRKEWLLHHEKKGSLGEQKQLFNF